MSCPPWKRTFTFVPLAPLTIIQSISHDSHNLDPLNGVIVITPIAVYIQKFGFTP
jgi:hypothetical protein